MDRGNSTLIEKREKSSMGMPCTMRVRNRGVMARAKSVIRRLRWGSGEWAWVEPGSTIHEGDAGTRRNGTVRVKYIGTTPAARV